MSNVVFEVIETWRKNNNLVGKFKTDTLLESYKNYTTSPLGLRSATSALLLITEAKRVGRFYAPSYKLVKRQPNYFRLTSAGKQVIENLDHAFKFAGFDNIGVERMKQIITEYSVCHNERLDTVA